MSRRPFSKAHPREPLIDPSMEDARPPHAVLMVSDVVGKPRVGRVSVLHREDYGRILQAAHVLGSADVDEGTCDMGVSWTSYRDWSPLQSPLHDCFGGAVVLTVVDVVDAGRVVVATFCASANRRVQWCPWFADESRRSAIVVDAAITRANVVFLLS